MFRQIKSALLVIVLILFGTSAYLLWRSTLPLVSPIALVEVLSGHSTASKSPKIIYGFFPYWNLKYANNLNINSLTHFAYFAIDLNSNGTINKVNAKKEQEPGWNKLNSKTTVKLLYQSQLLGQKTVLTVTAMEPDLIDSILNDRLNAATAISSILSVYRDFNFDDLNIDFEYVGNPNLSIRKNFVIFIQDLKVACLNLNKNCQLDVDIFADSGSKTRLWDLGALNSTVDHFIVMAYDYYRKNSAQAGPVAPLTGKCQAGGTSACLDQDILTHLSQITKLLPPEKILLGVPFYGYEWQTASRNFLANTYPRTGSLASYSRIQSLFSDPTVSSLSAVWSETTLSPYLIFETGSETHQVYYEDSASLQQKIKLVKSAGLGGIAIWAIGYETPYQELWGPINGLYSP